MVPKVMASSNSEDQRPTSYGNLGYEYTIGPRQTLPDESSRSIPASRIYSETLVTRKREVSLSAMAFLFQEMISHIHHNSKSASEFEKKLNLAGHNIGIRLLELLNFRASVLASNVSTRSTTFLSSSNHDNISTSNGGNTSGTTNINNNAISEHSNRSSNISGTGTTSSLLNSSDHKESLAGSINSMKRRDLKILDILQFIHGSVWTYLFGRTSDDLVKSSERNNEYMIVDNAPVLTEFMSGGVSCDYFVCGIIQGFLDNAGFKCKVTPHAMAQEQFDDKIVYLIQFDKQVLERESLRY